MRARTDEDLFVWAAERRRRILTENVRDFRRLMAQYEAPADRAAPRSRAWTAPTT